MFAGATVMADADEPDPEVSQVESDFRMVWMEVVPS